MGVLGFLQPLGLVLVSPLKEQPHNSLPSSQWGLHLRLRSPLDTNPFPLDTNPLNKYQTQIPHCNKGWKWRISLCFLQCKDSGTNAEHQATSPHRGPVSQGEEGDVQTGSQT